MCFVIIFVVYIVPFGDFAIYRLPNIAMQIITIAICAAIITILAKSVFSSLKKNKREWLFLSHDEVATGKSHINGLPANAKSFSNLRQAVSFLIQVIHCFRNFNIWFATHNHNLLERLTNVN